MMNIDLSCADDKQMVSDYLMTSDAEESDASSLNGIWGHAVSLFLTKASIDLRPLAWSELSMDSDKTSELYSLDFKLNEHKFDTYLQRLFVSQIYL